MQNGYTISETRGWEWHLNNADLARKYGISRERVRQIRKNLGVPKPAIRGEKERTVVDGVEKLKNKQSDISVENIKQFLKGKVSEPYLRLILNKHKIDFIHGNRKYPWEKINWNLPNITISDIWGIPYSDIVEYRNKNFEGDALWERNSEDEKFIRATEEEIKKAANFI